MRQRYAEEIKATQKLLEKSNVDCHDLQKQIVQIKAEKEEISKAMQYQENGHRTEIEILKKTLGDKYNFLWCLNFIFFYSYNLSFSQLNARSQEIKSS